MSELMVTIHNHHPSLSGHFPGHPVVPAVVILSEIMDAVRRNTTRSIVFSAIPHAKFLTPLAPGEELLIALQQEAEDTVAFTCRVGARLVAKGSFQYIIAASISGAENAS